MKAKERYDKKNSILSFRVEKDILDKVDKIVEERKKWDSECSRQKYLYHLLKVDLEKLETI